MRLSEWAEKHFYLSAESSYVEQRWVAFPFQTAIMDFMSNDEIAEVVVCKSARVGYTKMMMAAMGYFAEHKHRNQAVWQPTDEDADDFVKTEIDPMLRDVSAMKRVFPEYLSRHRNNTLRQKTFLGSVLHIRGGKAAKNYRRLSVDVALLDEVDGFDTDIEKEGSPITLSRKRIEGATFPKQILGSTPKLKNLSMIEARYDQAERRYAFHIPCPHCDAMHTLRFGDAESKFGFKFNKDDPESVQQMCENCGVCYTQAEYKAVSHRGLWIDQYGGYVINDEFFDIDHNPIPVPRSVGVRIWTAYSPMTTWAQIVREFLSAQAKAKTGDKSELKTFVNTTKGETWEEEVEETDQNALKQRAESYALRTVPKGGLVLVAGVDVQDDRFEINVWAIGKGEEMWIVDYIIIYANPAIPESWEKLDQQLKATYPHACGQHLAIEAAGIDSGGHFTHQVYDFCRHREKKGVHAIKGDSKQSSPIKGRSSRQDVKSNGKVIKNGVKLWIVGTDTAKDLIFSRLQLTAPGPGYMHFSTELPDEFYKQLTAEVRVLVRTAYGDQYRWIKRGRNEVLDCTVYAIFAAHMLDLHRYTEKMWQRLIDAIQPPTADMFAANESSIVLSGEENPASLSENVAPAIVKRALNGRKISLSGTRRAAA